MADTIAIANLDDRIASLRRRHPTERTNDEMLSRKLRRRGNVTHTARDLGVVAAQLKGFLGTVLRGPFTVTNLRRLVGGASKEQFGFVLDSEVDSERRSERMILSVNPPASIVETHRVREFQVLRALAGVIPVPPARWVISGAEPFGEPALICGFVDGVTAPTKSTGVNVSGLRTAYGELAAVLGPQLVDHLARLHTFDWRGADLSAFDVPAAGTTQAVDWRLALWDRVWEEDSFEAHPTITLTREWLWANRPAVDHISLIHGDYRNGNFLFDEDRATITAVLDWELAYLGDRHHDLAYIMVGSWGHDDASGRHLCSGLIPADELIARYERTSGLTVEPKRLKYYTVLNMYFLAVACSASAVRVVAESMTHLNVMMPIISGLGAVFIGELNKLLGEI